MSSRKRYHSPLNKINEESINDTNSGSNNTNSGSVSSVSSGSITNASSGSLSTDSSKIKPRSLTAARERRLLKLPTHVKFHNILSKEQKQKPEQKPAQEPLKGPEQEKVKETAQEIAQEPVKEPGQETAQEIAQETVKETAQETAQPTSSIDEPPLDSEISVDNFPEKLDIFGDLYSTQVRDGVMNTGPQTLYQFLKNYGLDATYGDEYKRILEAYARVFGTETRVKPDDLTCQTQDFFYIERGLRVRLGTLGAYIYSVGSESPLGLHYRDVANKIKRFLKSKANLQKCPEAPPAMAAPSTTPSITAEMSQEVLEIMKDVHKYLVEIRDNSQKIYTYLTNEKYSSQAIEKQLANKPVKQLLGILLALNDIKAKKANVLPVGKGPSTNSMIQLTKLVSSMQDNIGTLIEDNKKKNKLIKELQSKKPMKTAPLQAKTELQIALDEAERISKILQGTNINAFTREQLQGRLVKINETITRLETNIKKEQTLKPSIGSRVKGFFKRESAIPKSDITPTAKLLQPTVQSFSTIPSGNSFTKELEQPIQKSSSELMKESLEAYKPKGISGFAKKEESKPLKSQEELKIAKISNEIATELTTVAQQIQTATGIDKDILDEKKKLLVYLGNLYMDNDKINTENTYQAKQEILNKLYEKYNNIKQLDVTSRDMLDKLSKLYREIQNTYKLKQNTNAKEKSNKLLNKTKNSKSKIKKTINTLTRFAKTLRQRINPYTQLKKSRAETPEEPEPTTNSSRPVTTRPITNPIPMPIERYSNSTEIAPIQTENISSINSQRNIKKGSNVNQQQTNALLGRNRAETLTENQAITNPIVTHTNNILLNQNTNEELEELNNLSNEELKELNMLVINNSNTPIEEKKQILLRNYPNADVNNINRLFNNIPKNEREQLLKKIVKSKKKRRNSNISSLGNITHSNININLGSNIAVPTAEVPATKPAPPPAPPVLNKTQKLSNTNKIQLTEYVKLINKARTLKPSKTTQNKLKQNKILGPLYQDKSNIENILNKVNVSKLPTNIKEEIIKAYEYMRDSAYTNEDEQLYTEKINALKGTIQRKSSTNKIKNKFTGLLPFIIKKGK
jgi:hypothetical protein